MYLSIQWRFIYTFQKNSTALKSKSTFMWQLWINFYDLPSLHPGQKSSLTNAWPENIKRSSSLRTLLFSKFVKGRFSETWDRNFCTVVAYLQFRMNSLHLFFWFFAICRLQFKCLCIECALKKIALLNVKRANQVYSISCENIEFMILVICILFDQYVIEKIKWTAYVQIVQSLNGTDFNKLGTFFTYESVKKKNIVDVIFVTKMWFI